MARQVKVSSHTRNGKPVRGYVRRQTWSEKVGAVLAGHRKGNVKLAVLASVGIGVATAVGFTLHSMVAAVEVAGVLFGAGAAVLGLNATRRHRRRHPTKYRKRPVTLSYRDRKHYVMARLRKAAPMNIYRRKVQRARRRHPLLTGHYDRWLGKYEVTVTKGKGKTKTAETFTVRGVVNAETFLKQEQEKHRQKGGPQPSISRRQVFR